MNNVLPHNNFHQKAPETEEEVVHLAGDSGLASTFAGSKASAQGVMIYTGRWAGGLRRLEVTCEIYITAEGMMVSTCCVRCGQVQTIKSENKQMSYEKGRGLFIEPFECTWELDGDRRIENGLGMCKARVAYDGKVIKDA